MNNSSWMASVPDSRLITDMNIPGTHDSAACFCAFSFISRTQSLTVSQQLNAGVRYFDFRFRYTSGKFVASHSIATCKKSKGVFAEELKADDIVSECIAFLKENPQETILFQLKETVSNTGTEFYAQFYDRYIKNNPSFWYVKNEIPALGQVRGKIILFRVAGVDNNAFDDGNSGIDFTRYPYVGSRDVDDWRLVDICSIETKKPYAKLFVQDSYKVEGKKKWGTVTRFLENRNRGDLNICLTSCTCFFVPRINVKYINSQIRKYDFQKNGNHSIIVTDYIDERICSLIIGDKI